MDWLVGGLLLPAMITCVIPLQILTFIGFSAVIITCCCEWWDTPWTSKYRCSTVISVFTVMTYTLELIKESLFKCGFAQVYLLHFHFHLEKNIGDIHASSGLYLTQTLVELDQTGEYKASTTCSFFQLSARLNSCQPTWVSCFSLPHI